ncbi:MAG: adenylyltransferase/cytidyltransferase family protein, partial [Pseudomonadota bacterium]
MELIRGIYNLRPGHRGCVATIGNFDGVHLGHKEMVRRVMRKADDLGLPSLVITFEPQPAEFFKPEKAPARLSSVREKAEYLRALGVDRLLVLKFDEALSSMTPEQFVEKVLVEKLRIRALIIGDDFRFGKRRGGGAEGLRDLAKRHGFEILQQPSYLVFGKRISSTAIRG